jgi:hypothetical protein
LNDPVRGYDAFISYRSASSGRHARQLSRALHALSRRHLKDRRLSVFLDTDILNAGGLDTALKNALSASRALVVLLDPTTADSPWVAAEIEHWLASGGAPERLFLVRTDPQLDLTWDREASGFRDAEPLPAPLRTLFREEQKYFDVPSARSVDEASLAGLYAAVMGINAEELLLEESRYQQRRRRRSTAVIAGLAVLTLVAAASGVVAYRQSQRSEESARTARGEAAGAEALLNLSYSYPEAIDKALEASRLSSSQSVRSALIAVASSTGALRRTVDWADTGTGKPATGMSFDAGGERLTGWGPGEGDASHLAVWSIISGEFVVDGDVDVPDLAQVREVSPVGFVGCSEGRPVLLARRTLEVTRLDEADPGVAGEQCAVQMFGGGVLVQYGAKSGSVVVVYVSYRGEPLVLRDAFLGDLNPTGWAAPVYTEDGVVLVTPRGTVVTGVDGYAESVAGDGTTVIKTEAGRTRVTVDPATLDHDAVTLDVPDDALAVVLMSDFTGPNGEYAWVTFDGELGWSGDSSTFQLFDVSEFPPSMPYQPGLAETGDQSLVATFGGTAFTVGVPGVDTGWRVRPLTDELGSAEFAEESAILHSCRGGGPVGLHGGLWVIDEELVETRSEEATLVGCTLVDPGPPLSVDGVPVFDAQSGGEVVAPVDEAGVVALFRPGDVTQVLLTGGHVENPWRVETTDDLVASILGERTVTSTEDGLLVTDSTGGSTRLGEDRLVDISPSPDGRSAVATRFVETEPVPQYVDKDGNHELGASCDPGLVSWLPGPDFADDLDDADNPVPVVRANEDGGWRSCRDDAEYRFPDDVQVLDYEVGVSSARIVWREGSGEATNRLMTWRPGNEGSVEITDLPVPEGWDPGEVGYWLSDDGTALLATASGLPVAQEWHSDGDRWTAGRLFDASFGAVSAAAWSPDDSLVVLAGPTGAFELLDRASGRRLLSGRQSSEVSESPVDRAFTTQAHGLLYAHLANQSGDRRRIQVPVSFDRLREILCGLHDASTCHDEG